jgi:hypothetical protein
MRTEYGPDTYKIPNYDKGKDTGPETQTEQEYLPIAVQIKRFINSGEALIAAKKEMYQMGWDEDFNLNTVRPHAVNMHMNRVEMQEVVENAQETLSNQANTTGEPEPTETQPETTGSTDIPTETEPAEPTEPV